MTITETREFKTVHFCCGIGGCTLGMQQSAGEYKGVKGTFRTLYGIDNDAGACKAYEALTGSKVVCADMFDREQYIQFHGEVPPTDWHEITPEDLRAWAGGEYPDVIFISAPCKGFSRLLPNAAAQKPKYKALNKLALRSMLLAMGAWGDNPPAVIMFENVPGIETRGARLLTEIKTLLGMYGYVFHEGHHDCGEIGGLGQKRIRYLMIARNPKKLPSFIYQPPKVGHRTIGDILGPLPVPGDTEHGGKMHRLPNLAWRTWERLALIPAGKDWRALKDLNHTPQNGTFRIVPWDKASNVVTTEATAPGNASCINVADPRVPAHEGKRQNAYQVENWDRPAKAIIGQTDIQTGALSVADPRCTPHYNNILKVCRWDEPGAAITGGGGVMSGGLSVADPNISSKWSGAGNYKIMPWDEPANAVTASGDIHAGASAVADPRVSYPGDRGVWIIIAADDTWHRPITTFEMAMLQGFPQITKGKPFELPGNSDAKWREWIGNAVPVQTATAIGNALIATMLPNYAGDWHWDVDGNDLWVFPKIQDLKNIRLRMAIC